MGKFTQFFICQRSGFKYPISESVREPSTGLLVHYSESDGLSALPKPIVKPRQNEGMAKGPISTEDEYESLFLLHEDGSILTDLRGFYIILEQEGQTSK